ncbi:MAG: aminotransferase class I/II-fold pyridoxal phosphate-dependent enzyme [Bacteroidia bacterium]|nr:aminotransferase class I/II-fold pyridoxal phosphate-dependent enzyme [Bacteroidia bacterium]
MVDLVRQGADVIVSRTFSKIYGIAGLRIGYVIAKPELIRRMERYKMGIPVSQTALAAAQASLGDDAFMKLSRDNNAEARNHLFNYLDKQKFFYGKSFTNFVFADMGAGGRRIMDALSERGIGIRVWEFKGKAWCRVSVGTLDEMKVLTKALSEIIS